MSHAPDDASDNPYRPGARGVRDLGHDAQLLRDLSIINAETVARLGPLPPGGLPVQPKRKPNLPRTLPPIVTAAAHAHEDDPMKLHQMAAAAMLPLAVTACSPSIDAGSTKARLNPHPVKRYEVIATSDAPGPWDSIEGYIGYDVINRDCVPEGSFTGGQNVPNTGLDIEMTRVDDHTWKGYFYRDALRDEDYFGLGVCHWDATSAGIAAIAKGVRFNWGTGLEPLLHDGLQTFYFKKSVYGDLSFARYGAPTLTAEDPEVRQHPDAYFRATIAVKETMP
jgi:hypothetical protein